MTCMIIALHQPLFQVSMITGDSRETALSISAMLGLEDLSGKVLCGEEVDAMSDAQLEQAAPGCYCFYRTTPRHKVHTLLQVLSDTDRNFLAELY